MIDLRTHRAGIVWQYDKHRERCETPGKCDVCRMYKRNWREVTARIEALKASGKGAE